MEAREILPSAAARVTHFLDEYERIRALDPETIYSLHAGTDEPRACALTVADLRELVRCCAVQHPRPISITERLPRAGECLFRPHGPSDAGFCWFWDPAKERWMFLPVVFPRPQLGGPWVAIPDGCHLWLPHWAMTAPGVSP
jgi:hypothetical protein